MSINCQPGLLAGEQIEPQQIRNMVLSVIRSQQDYSAILQYMEPVTRAGGPLSSDTVMELALLLSDVEQQAALNDQLYNLVKDESSPTLVLTEAGVILAQNRAAATLFHTTDGENHSRLGISSSEFASFQQRIFTHRGPTLLQTWPESRQQMPLIMTASYYEPHHVFVLQSLECRWPESIDHALQELFDLTASERDILACLAQGMTAEQISEQRVRALGTVRQQIKTLMNKLGTHRQNQAVSLAAAIANRTQGNTLSHSQPGQISSRPLQLGEFVRDNRLVGWRRYGPRSGIPVLLLHGPFFGAGDFEHDRELAHQHNFCVWIPERPGYGRTQPAGRDIDPLENQLQDCLELMQRENIEQAFLLSHESGLIPALALAERAPQRFHGLLAVSPSGHFKPNVNLEAIPRQQRMLLWAARHAHWMLRMMIRLGMVQVRQLGPERWVEAIFADSPLDLKVLNEDSMRQGKLGTYHYNYSQNGAGLELDVQQTTTAWDRLVSTVRLPFLGIMGSQNATTPPDFVRSLLDLNDQIQLLEIPEAGQTLSLSHADLVFSLLAQMVENHYHNRASINHA
ncbi:alpha/beta fold hydrolase [Oceanobacter mangrovi]|uniref:alpha/beta fold hydrolase n=1 Tax=Oceanobacter mangrovi TaxID=2862510 RepID=UPI001C8E3D8D|nr:alpha/beta fold hydrolase [Oceanobacter mangrovi]